MTINTTGGAGLYIGGTTAIDFSTDQAALNAFEAITGWIKVGELEDLGEIGDSSADVPFNALGANRVRHLKGSRDAGTMTVVAGDDPSDPGQQALRAAERTKYNHNFMIIYEDAPDASSTDSVDYFRALVMSARKQNGTADNVMRRTFALGINSSVITVDSDTVTTLTLTPAAGALTAGTQGVAYNRDINVSNELGAPTFAVTAGSLPAGVSLAPATGILSGTPSAAGAYSFTVTATDVYGNSGSAAYTLTIANP